MKVYRVGIKPSETDGEGEDHDEWYGSLAEAKKRRAELIREVKPETPPAWAQVQSLGVTGQDFEIEEYEVIKGLSLTRFLLASLNHRNQLGAGLWYVSRKVVMPAATFRDGKRVRS